MLYTSPPALRAVARLWWSSDAHALVLPPQGKVHHFRTSYRLVLRALQDVPARSLAALLSHVPNEGLRGEPGWTVRVPVQRTLPDPLQRMRSGHARASPVNLGARARQRLGQRTRAGHARHAPVRGPRLSRTVTGAADTRPEM